MFGHDAKVDCWQLHLQSYTQFNALQKRANNHITPKSPTNPWKSTTALQKSSQDKFYIKQFIDLSTTVSCTVLMDDATCMLHSLNLCL